MSMFVRSTSSYQQLQNWSASQANLTNQIMGSATATADYSSAFTDAANNYYSSAATIAANEALTRVQKQAGTQPTASTSTPGVHPAIAAAQAAGNAILTSLGMNYSPQAASTTSSSGAYTAPINAATGYSYVASSAASLSSLGALNILA